MIVSVYVFFLASSYDIMDFCEELKEKYDVEYFFMRYVDPKPHVRLGV